MAGSFATSAGGHGGTLISSTPHIVEASASVTMSPIGPWRPWPSLACPLLSATAHGQRRFWPEVDSWCAGDHADCGADSLNGFDTRVLDHPRPIGRLRLDHIRKLIRCVVERHNAHCVELVAHIRQGHDLYRLPVQPFDDDRGGTCWHEQSVPYRDVKA